MATPPGLATFLHAERIQESGDNYTVVNHSSGAAGAYQFLFSTWRYALQVAGLEHTQYWTLPANDAPPAIQDEAAGALMSQYYYQFGQSWYNVAEAWYGGPGAVGHPNWGGGPGYPNVGQYASDVIAIYNRLGGAQAAPAPSVGPSPWLPGFQEDLAAYYTGTIQPAGIAWRASAQYLQNWIVPDPGSLV